MGKLAVFPTCKTLVHTDPKRSITGGEQIARFVAWQMLARRRLPGNAANAIKPAHSAFGCEPEISILCLNDRVCRVVGNAFADFPRSVRVLADVERRIEGGAASAVRQQDARHDALSSAHLLHPSTS